MAARLRQDATSGHVARSAPPPIYVGDAGHTMRGIVSLRPVDTMAAQRPTLADLRKTGIISSTEIVAAVDHYMRDPQAGPYQFASGHSIDIAAAIAASPEFLKLKARPGPQKKTFRNAVTVTVMAALAANPEPDEP